MTCCVCGLAFVPGENPVVDHYEGIDDEKVFYRHERCKKQKYGPEVYRDSSDRRKVDTIKTLFKELSPEAQTQLFEELVQMTGGRLS